MRLMLMFFAFFSLVVGMGTFHDFDTGVSQRIPAQSNPQDEDESVVLNGSLSLENQEEVARVLFKLSRNISEKYAISDGLSMVMYVLRYMAQIGEYEFVQKDLKALISSFENLLGEPFDPEVWQFVEQIRKLQFTRNKGKLSVKIYAIDEESGVTVQMNTPGEQGSAMKEISYVRLNHGARVTFSEATTDKDFKKVRSLVKDRFKILGFIGLVESDMNLVHPFLIDSIDSHLRKEREEIIAPLFIEFENAYVRVETSTIFKTMDFKFKEGVCIPGVKNLDGEAAPSFLITAQTGLLKLKTTIDQ